MKSKVSAAVAVACALALSGETSAWASFYEFTTLVGLPSGDYGAGTNEAQAYGINNQGQIVGLYVDSVGAHGIPKEQRDLHHA
jgi:hypothetical protein